MSIALCFLNELQAEEMQAEKLEELEELHYTLFKSVTPKYGVPSKYYKLSLSSKPIRGPGIVIIGRMDGKYHYYPILIDTDGMIRASDGYESIIGMDGGYGEKFEIVLVAGEKEPDLKPLAKCTIIPFPCIVQDDKGHKIELKPLTPDGQNFSITGSGFKPNKQINMTSRSCNESLSSPLKIDDQGKFSIIMCPAVIGKTEGPFEVTLLGEDMNSLKLRHYWGGAAFTNPNEYKTLRKKLPFPDEEKVMKKTRKSFY